MPYKHPYHPQAIDATVSLSPPCNAEYIIIFSQLFYASNNASYAIITLLHPSEPI